MDSKNRSEDFGLGILLALTASLLWGFGDFAGGIATRRAPVVIVALWTQLVGFCIIFFVALGTSAFEWSASGMLWSIGAGITGAAGLISFYLALAHGTMGVVAPISALSVAVPVLVDLVTGHALNLIALLGIVLAVGGVVISSRGTDSIGASVSEIKLAIASAVLFGISVTFLSRGAKSSPIMTLLYMRGMAIITLVAVLVFITVLSVGKFHDPDRTVLTILGGPASMRRAPARWSKIVFAHPLIFLIIASGALDTSANLAFAHASNVQNLAIAAVLSSLFPIVIIILGRVVFKERLCGAQRLGVFATLVSIILIAGWA